MQIGFTSLRMVCALVQIIGKTHLQSFTFRSRAFGEKSLSQAFLLSLIMFGCIFYFLMPKPILKLNK